MRLKNFKLFHTFFAEKRRLECTKITCLATKGRGLLPRNLGTHARKAWVAEIYAIEVSRVSDARAPSWWLHALTKGNWNFMAMFYSKIEALSFRYYLKCTVINCKKFVLGDEPDNKKSFSSCRAWIFSIKIAEKGNSAYEKFSSKRCNWGEKRKWNFHPWYCFARNSGSNQYTEKRKCVFSYNWGTNLVLLIIIKLIITRCTLCNEFLVYFVVQ